MLSLFKLNIEKGTESTPVLPKFPTVNNITSSPISPTKANKIFCPDCGAKLGPNFEQLILSEEEVFCEFCGHLFKKDILQQMKK
jgi:hypothetical protein